jgi:hypothetical protein
MSDMWMLKKMRFVHKWAGLAAAVLIIGIAFTGILMNHKDWMECGPGGRSEVNGDVDLSYFNDASAASVIELAASECGGMEIKEIKIEREGGRYVWEIKPRRGGKIKVVNGVRRGGSGEGKKDNALKELVESIHQGEFAGIYGRYLVDGVAGAIIILTLSGVYITLWVMWKKRRATRDRRGVEQV